MPSINENNNYKEINNIYAWILILMPAIYVGIRFMFSDLDGTVIGIMIAWFVLGGMLIRSDHKELQASGWKYGDMPSYWWLIFLPGYFLSRPAPIARKKWLAAALCFVLWVIVSIYNIKSIMLEDIDKTACNLTTRILKELNKVDRTCIGLVGKEKISDTFSIATVALDNGTQVVITIEERENNMIYVTVKNHE